MEQEIKCWILMLLLLAHVLTHINRFSKLLQTHNLINANVKAKLIQLKSALKCIEENDGPSFTKQTVSFLELAFEKTELSRRFHNTNLMPNKESPNQGINEFKTNIKAVFMKELLDELDKALRINNETFLAFDVFNAQMAKHHSGIKAQLVNQCSCFLMTLMLLLPK